MKLNFANPATGQQKVCRTLGTILADVAALRHRR